MSFEVKLIGGPRDGETLVIEELMAVLMVPGSQPAVPYQYLLTEVQLQYNGVRTWFRGYVYESVEDRENALLLSAAMSVLCTKSG